MSFAPGFLGTDVLDRLRQEADPEYAVDVERRGQEAYQMILDARKIDTMGELKSQFLTETSDHLWRDTLKEYRIVKVFQAYIGAEYKSTKFESKYGKGKMIGVDIHPDGYAFCTLLFKEDDEDVQIPSNCFNDIKLLLTPLSAISEEHAIEIAKMFWDRFSSKEKAIYWGRTAVLFHLCDISWDNDNEWDTANSRKYISEIKPYQFVSIFQFLVDNYYDVPLRILTGSTPIEAGIAIDKTKEGA